MFGHAPELPINQILGVPEPAATEQQREQQLALQWAFEAARLKGEAVHEAAEAANAQLRDPQAYNVGDLVWVACKPDTSLELAPKLQAPFEGPHQVVRVPGSACVEIKHSDTVGSTSIDACQREGWLDRSLRIDMDTVLGEAQTRAFIKGFATISALVFDSLERDRTAEAATPGGQAQDGMSTAAGTGYQHGAPEKASAQAPKKKIKLRYSGKDAVDEHKEVLRAAIRRAKAREELRHDTELYAVELTQRFERERSALQRGIAACLEMLRKYDELRSGASPDLIAYLTTLEAAQHERLEEFRRVAQGAHGVAGALRGPRPQVLRDRKLLQVLQDAEAHVLKSASEQRRQSLEAQKQRQAAHMQQLQQQQQQGTEGGAAQPPQQHGPRPQAHELPESESDLEDETVEEEEEDEEDRGEDGEKWEEESEGGKGKEWEDKGETQAKASAAADAMGPLSRDSADAGSEPR
ncbi:hypothetical protein JKP88DRAFT_245808 [Tribonema minus]|uniref:Uncharacterized protein n=1 Tax=Tribonema minus TaxID=303371 RepID=A0A835YWS1_9STRA|nr:hypothetical protein JKP88DRAFT_245808 [Tribonema minus]